MLVITFQFFNCLLIFKWSQAYSTLFFIFFLHYWHYIRNIIFVLFLFIWIILKNLRNLFLVYFIIDLGWIDLITNKGADKFLVNSLSNDRIFSLNYLIEVIEMLSSLLATIINSHESS